MYIETFRRAFVDYASYLGREIARPHWNNYFYWLIGVSLICLAIEWARPWRRMQSPLRRDFWLDVFYMFFNFFLFSLIGYYALSEVVVLAFQTLLRDGFGVRNLVALEVKSWPVWLQLATMLVLRDFIHFNVHRLLHRVPLLWQFHKVHHSVEQMGFAAHLRFHWMETVIYRTIEYLPLAMIGFGIRDFFIVHIIALSIGHLNHSNVGWDYGPLRYLLNSPKMHIWHHARALPPERRYGVNFGLTLSLWDYLFKTAYIPADGRDIELGVEDQEAFPVHSFWRQAIYPLGKARPRPTPR
ncbi:MAG: sterol desaturase family protein [Myxococcales bacterium]|nr:sterol desaturase family protein [Myxococcales bacterium]